MVILYLVGGHISTIGHTKQVHAIQQQQSGAQLFPLQNKVTISFVYDHTGLHLRDPIRPLAMVVYSSKRGPGSTLLNCKTKQC